MANSTPTVIVAGLGPGDPDNLTLGALRALESGVPITLRTENHPIVPFLVSRGITFTTFDDLYDRYVSYDDLYPAMARSVVATALKEGAVVFAVPGHPALLEQSVACVIEQAGRSGVGVRMIGGLSFLDSTLSAVASLQPGPGLTVLLADGESWPRVNGHTLIIAQVTSRKMARRTKMRLLADYGPGHRVYHVDSAGAGDVQTVSEVEIAALDRKTYGPLTTLVVPPLPGPDHDTLTADSFLRARSVVSRLRGPGGCPWDREQTPKSLRPYVIEEAHEVVAAIDSGNGRELCIELGDLMLQVFLLAEIAREQDRFSLGDVMESLSQKLIRRHPHVFGGPPTDNAGQVLRQWEEIKTEERGTNRGRFAGLPRSLPALLQACRVQEKASRVGFDWDRPEPVFEKVKEELAEVTEAYQAADADRIQEEVGDLLFAIVNLSRFLDIEPEMALRSAVAKFVARFEKMELLAGTQGKDLATMNLAEMDRLWEFCKRQESPDHPMRHKP